MKTLSFLLTLTLLLISINSYSQTAYKIKQGEASPITGVVITEDKAKDLYKAEQSNIVLKDLRIADKELIDHYKGVAKDSREKLSKAEFKAFWTNTGYFFLGVILASLAFKTTQEISR